MDYGKFSVEDFVADDYFLQWVIQQDREAEKFWNLFISLHPETKPKIDQARAFVLNLKQAGHNHDTDHQVENIWEGIQHRIEQSERPAAGKRNYTHLIYRIAASLIVIALFATGIYLSDKKPIQSNTNFAESIQSATAGFVEEVNTTEKTVRIHLSDGSIVDLEKNSRLGYKDNYAGEASRHVFLTGEAFFEVAKNPRQLFFVHANEVVTKVLGTSFRVKAYGDEKNITVAVKSGKVSVFSHKKVNATSGDVHAKVDGVILFPNEQVVYQRDDESFDKTLVESPIVLSPPAVTGNFIFENTPIRDAFRVLEDAYGIEIIFDEEVMKACFITAPLGSEPLFEKLRIICRTIGANYEIIDTKVVINSSGCQ